MARATRIPARVLSLAIILLLMVASLAAAQGSSEMVYLKGAVKNPGEYPIAQNPTLYRLLASQSGLTDADYQGQAMEQRGEIVRTTQGDEGAEIIPFNVREVLRQEPGSNVPLQPQDLVRVYAQSTTKAFDDYVWITGYVEKPGKYDLTEGMTLADLLVQAGGFEPEAYMMDAEVARTELGGVPGDTLTRSKSVQMLHTYAVAENPEDVLSLLYDGNTPAGQFKLQPYDQVHIRKSPDLTLPNTVLVKGQVLYPGTYTLERRNETLSELINRAGGVTSDAYVAGGKLMRAAQEVGFERTMTMLRREMQQARENLALREQAVRNIGGLSDAAGSMEDAPRLPFSAASTQLGSAAAGMIKEYEAAIRNYQDAKKAYEDALILRKGMKRINVDMHALLVKGDEDEDVVLQEGDQIIIPKSPGTVTVLGMVRNPGVFNYSPGKDIEFYIDLAGGRSSGAGEATVNQPSGYSSEVKWLNNPEVMEGAVIRVLSKPVRQ